jgi:hypothetical protein
VRSWFQAFAFKCNMCRHVAARKGLFTGLFGGGDDEEGEEGGAEGGSGRGGKKDGGKEAAAQSRWGCTAVESSLYP